MTGAMPPAEMADRIGSYQRWAKQEIEKQHGLVDKFAGDAVMATFNVSGTEVDHALHALKAAFALRDKAALLGLPVGIGIAVGPAVVGRLTGGANTSVLGETTNLAARLQAQADAGEVVLSAEARRRLLPWLEEHSYDAVGDELNLKGFSEPVPAYRLRRKGDAVLELR
jgi:class 3 adenylate cyclase